MMLASQQQAPVPAIVPVQPADPSALMMLASQQQAPAPAIVPVQPADPSALMMLASQQQAPAPAPAPIQPADPAALMLLAANTQLNDCINILARIKNLVNKAKNDKLLSSFKDANDALLEQFTLLQPPNYANYPKIKTNPINKPIFDTYPNYITMLNNGNIGMKGINEEFQVLLVLPK